MNSYGLFFRLKQPKMALPRPARRPAVWGQESVLDGPIERSVDRTFERSACWGASGFYTLVVDRFFQSAIDRSLFAPSVPFWTFHE